MLANFPGLAELGFIAGSGELLCLIASFTVLPALLAVSQRSLRPRPAAWRARPPTTQPGWSRFPRLLLGGLGALTLVGLYVSPLPQFDYNLLHLQAEGTESVVWENRLLEASDRSSWYALSTADSLAELQRKQAQFAAHPLVERVESLATLLPPNQPERRALIADVAPLIDAVSGTWEQVAPLDLHKVIEVLGKIRFKLQRPPSDWDPSSRPSEAGLAAARNALIAVQDHLKTMSSEAATQALDRFQRSLMADFAAKWSLLQRNGHPSGLVTLGDVPSYLRERFVGQSGRYLLQIFARGTIWERDPLRTFVSEMQKIDPDITGPPVVAYYSISNMRQGYVRGGLYAFLAIVGITFLHFRRVKPTVLAWCRSGLQPFGWSRSWPASTYR